MDAWESKIFDESMRNERQFELPLDDNLRKYPKIVLGTAR